jgi:hypothetical protein
MNAHFHVYIMQIMSPAVKYIHKGQFWGAQYGNFTV